MTKFTVNDRPVQYRLDPATPLPKFHKLIQAAMGWIGGDDIKLPAAQLKLETRHASVAVQSLDDLALGASRNVMLSIGTRSEPLPGNKTPFRVEPLAGEIKVKAGAPDDEVQKIALADPGVMAHLEGVTVRKVIVVPGKIVNIVAAP